MDLKDIDLEELPEDQRNLANLIGLEAFSKLVEVYGGLLIYIPKRDGFIRAARNEAIRSKFNGSNYRKLAIEYNLTEVAIRMIVSDIDKEMRARPIDGQANLFEPEE